MSGSHSDSREPAGSLSRRHWLKGAASLAGLGALPAHAQKPPSDSQVTDAPHSLRTDERVSCWGEHQAGVVTPRPSAGMVASFDVIATDRKELERLFRGLSERIVFLTQGGDVPQLDPRLPPADSGIMGPHVQPDGLTITVSVGDALFDDRFGLKDRKPHSLRRMQSHPNDALDAALCHGDLSIQICSNTPDTNIHALRDIIKQFPDLLILLWKQEGTVPPVPERPGMPAESARNFLGFRDGSANPNANNRAEMREIVWVDNEDQDEPAWTYGGTYQAVRIIRNFVERWDRTPLQEQEAIFGRQRDSGAPLDGGKTEHDVPDFTKDPEGKKTPLDSHIRLANPRTKASHQNLILRRPFNYSNGVTKSGQLEMGLLFICYQANLEKGFITVQKRLDGEPLEEYIKPIGGGFFFTLPGMRDKQDWLGRTLLDAA